MAELPIDDSTFIARTCEGTGVEVFTDPNKIVSTERLVELKTYAERLLTRSKNIPGRAEVCLGLQRWIADANDDIALHTADSGEEALRLGEKQIDKM